MVIAPGLRRGAMLLGLVGTLIAAGGRTVGAEVSSGGPSEYQVKAAYLYYLATFVDWPPEALPLDSDSLIIGVLGDDPFGDILEATVRGKIVNNRSLIVSRIRNVKNARQCNILFISSSEQGDLPTILKFLDGAAILTVGEFGEFAARGGQIGFRTEDRKVRFDINIAAVERSGLKISAQLMKLGRIVKESERPGG